MPGLYRDSPLLDLSPNERFQVKRRCYSQQYAEFYQVRLDSMSPALIASARNKWGHAAPIHEVCEVKFEERCILLGTVFKQMELQPSILKELSEELNVQPQPFREKYLSDSDVLFLEDKVQRIALTGNIDPRQFVTGVVIAVIGKEHESQPGYFDVEDVAYLELSCPRLWSLSPDRYVLLLSGLELGGKGCKQVLLDALAEYLSGHLDSTEDEEITKISQVIIAGNSISHETHDKEHHYKAKYLTKNTTAGTVDAVASLARYLETITKSVPVILMPGEFDPTNHMLPQQSLHPVMFTDRSGALELVTNPFCCVLDGVQIMGTSGQPITNILSYSNIGSSIDVMQKTLLWGHLAPTAPDTLGAYPFTDTDPFILTHAPHIYFCGNQPRFETTLTKTSDNHSCLCISLPKFSETGVCVLVNLQTFACEPLMFAADA